MQFVATIQWAEHLAAVLAHNSLRLGLSRLLNVVQGVAVVHVVTHSGQQRESSQRAEPDASLGGVAVESVVGVVGAAAGRVVRRSGRVAGRRSGGVDWATVGCSTGGY